MSTRKILAAMAALSALATAAGAQAPATAPAPPAHHGFLGNLLHRHSPMTPGMAPGMRPGMAPGMGGGSGMPLAGGIIGNKNSHVYHLASDRSALPSAANRVYFRTEQQALAAGYHHAGSRNTPGGKTGRMHKMRGPAAPMGGTQ